MPDPVSPSRFAAATSAELACRRGTLELDCGADSACTPGFHAIFASRLRGPTPPEDWRACIDPSDRPLAEAFMGRHGVDRARIMIWIVDLAGTRKKIEITRLDDSEAGRPRFVFKDITAELSTLIEVTRSKDAIAEVTHSASLGEVMATVAHELSQPLTAILTDAQATTRGIQAGTIDRSDLKSALEDIVVSSRRANAVLVRARNRPRMKTVGRETIDINTTVIRTLAEIGLDLDRNEIQVSLSLAPQLPPVHCRRLAVQQILHNLLRNAIEALIPVDERRILVVTSRKGNSAGIEIIDTGPGFAVDEPERVFDTFFTTKENGMGMGLAISRTIAREEGGDLTVATNTSGGGHVQLTLPISEADDG